jgi:aspartate carbamoyltransferase catalytic subunit
MGASQIDAILARSAEHKKNLKAGVRAVQPLAGRVIGNMFFEDSTRTRSSFEIAAKMLGGEVLNWTTHGTSVSKGETLLDSVRNIDAMGPVALVIRHKSSGSPALIARHVRCAVINAGDGQHEHPSQALLDAFTLREKLGSLTGKTVAIVGDILHSRVARSNIHCLGALGAKVVVCGPPTLLPEGIEKLGCTATIDFNAALEACDAVMMLRIQLERMTESLFPSAREYGRLYGLNAQRLARMKPEAIVLHPGPINRGVEMTAEAADGPRSVILDQVENGVAVRMTILERAVA